MSLLYGFDINSKDNDDEKLRSLTKSLTELKVKVSVNKVLSISNEVDTIANRLNVEDNDLQITKNKTAIRSANNRLGSLSYEINSIQNNMAGAKFRKATGEFYIGNSQGTFEIINMNMPRKYSLLTIILKAKRGLSGLYEATV